MGARIPDTSTWDYSKLTGEQKDKLAESWDADPIGTMNEVQGHATVDQQLALAGEAQQAGWDNFVNRVLGNLGPGKLFWPEPVVVGGIPINVVEVENPKYTGKVTQYAREDGSPLTDHMLNNPVTIDLKGCWCSDALLHRVYWEGFKQLQRNRIRIPYITGMEMHDNMVIVALNGVYKQGADNEYGFDMTLQKVLTASAQDSTESTDPGTGEANEGGGSDGGEKPPTDEKADSWLVDLGNWIFNVDDDGKPYEGWEDENADTGEAGGVSGGAAEVTP